MNVDAFLESVSDPDLRLRPADAAALRARAPETIDALFHLPLLALAIMVIARRTAFQTVALGRNVAMLLVEHFTALRRSPHGLQTSLTLRRRCADALALLEAAGLVTVSSDVKREVALSQSGKQHLDHMSREGTELGLFVRQFRANQERVRVRSGGQL
jgi:hypothetical protein